MMQVFYLSSFIPPEWIAAHGLEPIRSRLSVPPGHADAPGVCAHVSASIEQAKSMVDTLLVLATTCDQMRRAAEVIADAGPSGVFLFNMPATWGKAARNQYRSELERLSRFLINWGGTSPDRACLVAAQRLRSTLTSTRPQADGIPIALVGGCLLTEHEAIHTVIERFGASVVLCGLDGAERTAPAWPRLPADADPLELLTAAYFDAIPDVFRRPDLRLCEWVVERARTSGAKGIIFHSYTWCDLWRAARHHLAEAAGLPALFLELGSEPKLSGRTLTRIEAFVESLA